MKTVSARQRLLASTVLFGALMVAAPALAQSAAGQPVSPTNTPAPTDAGQPAPGAEGAVNDPTARPNQADASGQQGQTVPSGQGSSTSTAVEGVVVTGSRLRSPNLISEVPVRIVTANSLTNTGYISIGDVLDQLPALHTTFNTANSQRFIGTTGLNFLDLRDLGTVRTLVLVNGRRHVSASEGSSEVDTNTIPTDLIDRVDIVTGGDSSVYGSDAVAGVVNFILKRNFEGLSIRGQEGISSRGDGNAYFVSATGGRNFDNGRGNIAISAEYAKQDQIRFVDRPFSRNRGGFVVVEADPAGAPNGAAGGPDRIFVPDIHSSNISDGGTFVPTGLVRSELCTTANAAANPQRCLPNGQRRLFRFQPDGSLQEANYGLTDFRPLANSTYGGDGSSFANFGDLLPQLERYSVNLLGHWDLSNYFKPYFEAKAVRVNAFSEGTSGPSFNSFGATDFTVVDINNPYLTPQARAKILAVQPSAATQGFIFNRNNLDLGDRNERNQRDTYRIVVGAQGDIGYGFSYDASLNYGELRDKSQALNNRVEQRYSYAFDSVRDPASGKIVCRVTIDPTARVAYAPGLEPYIAGDVAACVPINPFGAGASAAARSYVNTTSQLKGYEKQFVASASVTGDSSRFFSLPAGPIGIAFGGEYRREEAYSAYDALVQAGGTFLNSIPTFAPPDFEVKEGYGEVRVPILANLPFAQELTASSAFRVSDYKGATGTVVAYNAGGIYAPIRDFRFRLNYSVSVRAPNQSDLYSPLTQNFFSVTDPCDVINIGGGTATRAANCLAAGIPVNQPGGFINDNARAATPEGRSGGNPNLQAETSKSWTIGVVFQPTFIPGFTATVDYYDITVENVIASPGVQNVLNNCYDAVNLNNAFCSLFKRDPVTHFFVPGSILDVPLNFAKRKARGIDFDFNYRRSLGDFGTLSLRALATYVRKRDNYPFLTDPNRPQQLLYDLGDPEWTGVVSADWKIKNVTIGYQIRYISHQLLNAPENYFIVGGRPPQNIDYASIMWYPDVYYHSARVTYDISPKYSLYGGVENFTDEPPPFGLTGVGAGSGVYDNRGRYFYLGATAKF